MSARPLDDPRQEAAALAAAARRWLEREEAAGIGDLAATSALRAMVASAASSAPAPAGGVDLFGKPLPEAPVSERPIVEAPSTEVIENPFDDELDPGGVEARADIEGASTALLSTIASEVRACKQCGLCDTRIQAVPGVGSARSGIVFVGEAPGADEDRRGEPFVGRAGELLTRIIKAMDDARLIPGVPLTRDTVYICNVLKCRPPENRNPEPDELDACRPYIRRQVELIQPKVIVALGRFALQSLLEKSFAITSARGQWLEYHGVKVMPTYHPAYLLRTPAAKKDVWADMKKVMGELGIAF